MDSATLPLLIGQGQPGFVRFDKEYAYGSKAEAFNKLARAAVKTELIVGSVGISTYGEKENQDLAEKYGYKEQGKDLDYSDMDTLFPQFRFFPANGLPDVAFTGDATFEAMAEFMQKELPGIEIGSPDDADTWKTVAHSRAEHNIINLDTSTLPKVVDHALPCFIRFDKEYSYGEKANAFKDLAGSVVGSRLLIGNVGISTHGEKKNQDLAEQYGYKEKGKDLQEDQFPKFRFFPANGGQDYEYTGDVTVEAITNFLKKDAKIYFGAKGTLQEFDKLAADFMKAADKQDVFTRAKAAADTSPEHSKTAAAYYVRHMAFALNHGAEWFKIEHDRIKLILDQGKLVAFQKEELTLKTNRLQAFVSPHDEL